MQYLCIWLWSIISPNIVVSLIFCNPNFHEFWCWVYQSKLATLFNDTSNGPKFFIVKKLQTFFNPWKLLPMNINECRDVLMGRTVWGFGWAVEDGVYLVDRGRNQLYYQRDLLLHTGVLVTGMKQLLDSRLLNKTRGDISCYFYILWIS